MTRRGLVSGLFVWLLLPTLAGAVTFKGTVPNGATRSYTLQTGNSGHLLLSVSWTKSSADLDLAVLCDSGPAGLSASDADRSERLDLGVLPGECEIQVISFSGKSKYYLNIQQTNVVLPRAPGARTLTARPATESGAALTAWVDATMQAKQAWLESQVE